MRYGTAHGRVKRESNPLRNNRPDPQPNQSLAPQPVWSRQRIRATSYRSPVANYFLCLFRRIRVRLRAVCHGGPAGGKPVTAEIMVPSARNSLVSLLAACLSMAGRSRYRSPAPAPLPLRTPTDICRSLLAILPIPAFPPPLRSERRIHFCISVFPSEARTMATRRTSRQAARRRPHLPHTRTARIALSPTAATTNRSKTAACWHW